MHVSHCEFTYTSSPNKMLLSKGIEKYGIEVPKLLCFVDFPISSFSLTDKTLTPDLPNYWPHKKHPQNSHRIDFL